MAVASHTDRSIDGRSWRSESAGVYAIVDPPDQQSFILQDVLVPEELTSRIDDMSCLNASDYISSIPVGYRESLSINRSSSY